MSSDALLGFYLLRQPPSGLPALQDQAIDQLD